MASRDTAYELNSLEKLPAAMIVLLCCFCILTRSFSASFFGNVYFLTTGAITHNVMFPYYFFFQFAL